MQVHLAREILLGGYVMGVWRQVLRCDSRGEGQMYGDGGEAIHHTEAQQSIDIPG